MDKDTTENSLPQFTKDTPILTIIKETLYSIFQTPIIQNFGKYLFLQPALLVTLVILFTYFIGYFGFSILWCFFITTTIGSICKILLKRKIRESVIKERKSRYLRIQKTPKEESCDWLNNILSAVYGNHNAYISHLFVRFANPLLQKLCTPHPIETVEFRQLDITSSPPKLNNIKVTLDDCNPVKNLNYEFDVIYNSDYNGVVVSKLSRTPEIPVFISNLKFKAKMGFAITFVTDHYPFISSLRWYLITKPKIDISVKAGGLPGALEMPSVTEHFLELVAEEMYSQIGGDKYVEANFTSYIEDKGINTDVERFVNNINKLIPEMITHGKLSGKAELPKNQLDPNFPVLGAVTKAVRKISKKKENSNLKPSELKNTDNLDKQVGNTINKSNIRDSGVKIRLSEESKTSEQLPVITIDNNNITIENKRPRSKSLDSPVNSPVNSPVLQQRALSNIQDKSNNTQLNEQDNMSITKNFKKETPITMDDTAVNLIGDTRRSLRQMTKNKLKKAIKRTKDTSY